MFRRSLHRSPSLSCSLIKQVWVSGNSPPPEPPVSKKLFISTSVSNEHFELSFNSTVFKRFLLVGLSLVFTCSLLLYFRDFEFNDVDSTAVYSLSLFHPACTCVSRGLCDQGWCPFICICYSTGRSDIRDIFHEL